MSVPKSKRKPTQNEFYDKFVKLRIKLTMFITDDLSDNKIRWCTNSDNTVFERMDFWKYDEERRAILKIMSDMLNHITHANSIFPTCREEFIQRRALATLAIGDCEYLIQELQCASQIFHLKPNKYILMIDDILTFEGALKRWRKSDNKYLKNINNNDIIIEG